MQSHLRGQLFMSSHSPSPLALLSADPAVGAAGCEGGLPVWHAEGARPIPPSSVELPQHRPNGITLLLKMHN